MAEIQNLNTDEILGSGYWPDYAPISRPLWDDMLNVYFNQGKAEKFPGWAVRKAVTNLTSIRTIAQESNGGNDYVYLGGNNSGAADDKLVRILNNTTEAVLGSGYTQNTVWSIVPWNDWVFASNNDAAVQVSKAGAAATSVTTPFTTCRFLHKSLRHLLAINTDLGDQGVYWTNENDPEDFSTGAFGNITMRELEGGIVAKVGLSQHIALFSPNSMQLLFYRGYPFYFSAAPNVIRGMGAAGPFAAVVAGNFVYSLNKDGAFRSSGVAFESITRPAIQEWIKENVNFDTTVAGQPASHHIRAIHRPELECVQWFVLTGTSADTPRGLVYNYRRKIWMITDGAVTAASDRLLYDYPLGVVGTDIVDLGSGYDQGSSGMQSYLQTKPMDFDLREREKMIDFVRFYLERTGNLTIRIGVMENLDDSISWIDDSLNVDKIDVNRSGHYFIFRVQTSGSDTGTKWELTGWSVHGQGAGKVRS